jgi:SOS-response transcriptional repressor LexA
VDEREARSENGAGGEGGLGGVVRRRRRELGLSLERVAERAGCAKSYLSAVENGRKGPPTEELLTRLEGALELEAGELVRAARWAATPGSVKRDVARLEAERRTLAGSIAQIRALVRDRGLDGAFRSGELARLVERAGGGGVGEPVRVVLPVEVPLINKVSAGYPTEFTDLGYPARVADEYVRCPDLHDADAFAARVVGDSMEPEYREGDIVVFSPMRGVKSGDDCFVRLEPDQETTFKRVFFEGEEGSERIRIQPLNPRYAARVVERERVAGLYRAVQLMRAVE